MLCSKNSSKMSDRICMQNSTARPSFHTSFILLQHKLNNNSKCTTGVFSIFPTLQARVPRYMCHSLGTGSAFLFWLNPSPSACVVYLFDNAVHFSSLTCVREDIKAPSSSRSYLRLSLSSFHAFGQDVCHVRCRCSSRALPRTKAGPGVP